MAEKVQLLNAWPSPYGMRVQVALALKGVEYETLPQDLGNKSELLLQSNPVYKKIPVLLHNGKPICESLVIVQYVDEEWQSSGGAKLLPADPHERATARFWADFVDKKMADTLFGALKAKVKGTEEERKTAEENVVALLSTLEGVLAKEKGPFFGGAHMDLVDVAVVPLQVWLPAVEEMAELHLPWAEKLPLLKAALEAMRSNPATAELPDPAKLQGFISQVVIPRWQQS